MDTDHHSTCTVEPLEPTFRSELGSRRCAEHGFVLSPDGVCLRCRRDEESTETRRRIAWLGAGAAVILAACAVLLMSVRARASVQAVAPELASASQPASREAWELADQGSAWGRPHQDTGMILAGGSASEPFTQPTVTPAIGLGGKAIDRILAEREAEKEALARKLIADDVSRADEALAAMNHRVAQDKLEQQQLAAAIQRNAPPRPPTRHRVRGPVLSWCGCTN